jgi:hypothetical protein
LVALAVGESGWGAHGVEDCCMVCCGEGGAARVGLWSGWSSELSVLGVWRGGEVVLVEKRS